MTRPPRATLRALALLCLTAASCGSGASPDRNGVADDAADGPPPLVQDGGAAADETPGGPDASSPTWHQQIAPLVIRRCGGCHQPGGIAPFSLLTHANAAPLADALVEAVRAGTMPPWNARETPECTPRLPFRDDNRLSETEKVLLERWAAGGAPAGNPDTAAAVPTPPSTALANPSRRTTMTSSFKIAGNRDLFRCFVLPYEMQEDVWVTGLQVIPGNPKVVHHVLVWLDQDHKADALAGPDGSYECFGAPGFDSQLVGAWARAARR